jgi:hypothetical protein
VAGLAAKASYIISNEPSGNGNSVGIVRGSGGINTDGAGLLKLTF